MSYNRYELEISQKLPVHNFELIKTTSKFDEKFMMKIAIKDTYSK